MAESGFRAAVQFAARAKGRRVDRFRIVRGPGSITGAPWHAAICEKSDKTCFSGAFADPSDAANVTRVTAEARHWKLLYQPRVVSRKFDYHESVCQARIPLRPVPL